MVRHTQVNFEIYYRVWPFLDALTCRPGFWPPAVLNHSLGVESQKFLVVLRGLLIALIGLSPLEENMNPLLFSDQRMNPMPIHGPYVRV